jgi:hypothetical protein
MELIEMTFMNITLPVKLGEELFVLDDFQDRDIEQLV